MRRAWLLLPLLAGCYDPTFPEGLECSERAHCPEGQTCDPATGRCWSIDASPCPGDALSLPLRILERCDIPAPTGSVVLPAALITIDTTAGTVISGDAPLEGLATALLTQVDGGTPAMAISAYDLTVPAGAEVRVTGSRPLVLIALRDLVVDGTIDASAAGSSHGPGANLTCAIGTGAAGVRSYSGMDRGGTGGGGGGYGGAGAAASEIAPQPVPPASIPGGGTWGDAGGPLLGGCPGGAGGVGFPEDVDIPAPGGGGGGGLALVGGRSIAITGIVSVSGGGGGYGGEPIPVDHNESAGGAGGGSGGKLLVHAWTVTLTGARLTGNGGGGGEGRLEDQAVGIRGQDGTIDSDVVAGGGAGGAGGDGGAGATGSAEAAAGTVGVGAMDMPAGGGGGGGGVGRIVIEARETDFTESLVSPAAAMP